MSQANQERRQKKNEPATSSFEDFAVAVIDITDSKTSQKKKELAAEVLYLDRI